MKKLLVAAAALAAGVASASIVSSSIVGYNTINITKEYTLLTVSFDAVNGSALSIQDAFPCVDGMTKGQTSATADNIQVMTEDGDYDIYFLSNGRYGKNGANYSEAIDGKWVKAGALTATDRTLPAGTAFWYLSRGAKTAPFSLVVAGAVGMSESETYTINKAYTLIGCPYPCDVALNGGIEVTGSTKGQTTAAADNIQIMKDDGDYDIYFLSNGHYGKNGANYNEALDGKWAKAGSLTATEDKFPAGKGAFYLSRSKEGSVKFVNPIAE
jgi:hypothetical protein